MIKLSEQYLVPESTISMFASVGTQPGSTEDVTDVTSIGSASSSQARAALNVFSSICQPWAPESSTYPLLISCHCKGYMKSAEGVAQQLFKTTLNLD